MSDEFVYMNATDVVFGKNSTARDWRLFVVNKIASELEYDDLCELHHHLISKYGKYHGNKVS